MLFASIAVLAVVAALAIGGVLMTPIAPAIWRAVGRYPRLRLGIGLYQSGGLSSPADRLKLKSVGGAAIADQFRNDRLSSSNWRFARLKVASGLMAKIPNAIAPAVADVAAFSKRFRAG
jgi:hypothetical protein